MHFAHHRAAVCERCQPVSLSAYTYIRYPINSNLAGEAVRELLLLHRFLESGSAYQLDAQIILYPAAKSECRIPTPIYSTASYPCNGPGILQRESII